MKSLDARRKTGSAQVRTATGGRPAARVERRDLRHLAQALTDRTEPGPYEDWPLASWTIDRTSAESPVLCADLTPSGSVACELALYRRPTEAAERYGRLLARLWPGLLHSVAAPRPDTGLDCHRTATELRFSGPSLLTPLAIVEARLTGLDPAAWADVIDRALQTEHLHTDAGRHRTPENLT